MRWYEQGLAFGHYGVIGQIIVIVSLTAAFYALSLSGDLG